MDFGQALLVIGTVYALTKWFSSIVPNLDSRLKPLVAMVIAIGAVFLVAETVWSNDQVIQGHSLEGLDGWSKLELGILLGSGAVVLDTIQKAVRNIGQSDPAQYPPGTQLPVSPAKTQH